MITRRGLSLGLALAPLLPAAARAASPLRVGDQHALARGTMEAAGVLTDLAYDLEWAQFPAAAPVLEALDAGVLDLGFTGDIPFLFAYAAGLRARVIGGVRSSDRSNAILVARDSPIRTLADLKGRSIAANHGGNGQFMVLAALEHAGLDPRDVTIRFLAPGDAHAAFRTDAVDAWAVWEPYVSIAEATDGARVLATGEGVFPSRTFALAHLDALRTRHDQLADFRRRFDQASRWALDHLDENSSLIAKLPGVPLAIARRSLGITQPVALQVEPSVVAETQREADLFHRHNVLPRPLDVSDAFDATLM